MAHMILIGEGLPEALERFEAEMDRHTFGKGVVRLRPIKLYDIQYPKEMEAEIKDNFGLHAPAKASDTLAYSLKMEENPFKHGRLQGIICIAIRLFGWPLGLKPPGLSSTKPTPGYNKISTANINFYPVAFADDNIMVNKAQGREEEWL